MFLRWLRYRDKDGHVRLYARLLHSRRVGGKVRHVTDCSLRIRGILAGAVYAEQDLRDLWHHLDHVIRHASPRERANIERVFASEMGPRPPESAHTRAVMAMLAPFNRKPPPFPLA
jgi:hypothetical protein